ncbi:MAG: hypothetical protein RL699_1595 [Bacteroidota bacterium]|jgi:hypothetical protein
MVTLRVKENSKQAKAFLEFVKGFSFVEVVQDSAKKQSTKSKSPYNADFVSMVKEADAAGEYQTIDPKKLWESLGLK